MFMLLAEFESPVIKLEDVAPKYFNIHNERKYKSEAAANRLPIPFFRASSTQKGTWLCHVQDLADLIDKKRKSASDEYEKM